MTTMLRALRAVAPSSIALVDDTRKLSYGELCDLAARTGAGLRTAGVVPGDHVIVAAPTGADAVVAMLGVQSAGAVAVMLNHRGTTPENTARCALVQPSLAIIGASSVELPGDLRVARVAGSAPGDALLLDGPPAEDHPVASTVGAAVLFTSGVSGEPHAVHLSHGNFWAAQRGQIDMPGSGLSPATVGLVALPLAHIFGLNSVLGAFLHAGGTAVLMERFDPEAAAALIRDHRVNAVSAVPQMWHAFAMAGLAGDTFAGVTRAIASAAALPTSTVEALTEQFGVKLAGAYGLTETAGTVVLDHPQHPRTGTVGRPLGDTEIRLVDADGDDAEPGDPGEIWLRGSSVCTHYRTAAGVEPTLESGSWFRTGDVGVLDGEARLSIVDRIKDVIIVGGFNVSPSEVEIALRLHPGVANAAVVGEPDERSGERVVAYVRPVASMTTTADELTAHCKRQLARYKVPVRFEIRADLPVTDSGKVLRRLLR